MRDLILETKSLTKGFRGQQTPALEQVSLRIPEGCVYGLLGPNGAGKSTLLKIITGMMRPDSGEVLYKGNLWTRQCLQNTGALIANSHFLRPAGPHFPASQGHIKRSALEIGRARGAPPC